MNEMRSSLPKHIERTESYMNDAFSSLYSTYSKERRQHYESSSISGSIWDSGPEIRRDTSRKISQNERVLLNKREAPYESVERVRPIHAADTKRSQTSMLNSEIKRKASSEKIAQISKNYLEEKAKRVRTESVADESKVTKQTESFVQQNLLPANETISTKMTQVNSSNYKTKQVSTKNRRIQTDNTECGKRSLIALLFPDEEIDRVMYMMPVAEKMGAKLIDILRKDDLIGIFYKLLKCLQYDITGDVRSSQESLDLQSSNGMDKNIEQINKLILKLYPVSKVTQPSCNKAKSSQTSHDIRELHLGEKQDFIEKWLDQSPRPETLDKLITSDDCNLLSKENKNYRDSSRSITLNHNLDSPRPEILDKKISSDVFNLRSKAEKKNYQDGSTLNHNMDSKKSTSLRSLNKAGLLDSLSKIKPPLGNLNMHSPVSQPHLNSSLELSLDSSLFGSFVEIIEDMPMDSSPLVTPVRSSLSELFSPLDSTGMKPDQESSLTTESKSDSLMSITSLDFQPQTDSTSIVMPPLYNSPPLLSFSSAIEPPVPLEKNRNPSINLLDSGNHLSKSNDVNSLLKDKPVPRYKPPHLRQGTPSPVTSETASAKTSETTGAKISETASSTTSETASSKISETASSKISETASSKTSETAVTKIHASVSTLPKNQGNHNDSKKDDVKVSKSGFNEVSLTILNGDADVILNDDSKVCDELRIQEAEYFRVKKNFMKPYLLPDIDAFILPHFNATPKAMSIFLRYLFSMEYDIMDFEVAVEVCSLAMQFKESELFEHCLSFFRKSHMPSSNVGRILKLAQHLGVLKTLQANMSEIFYMSSSESKKPFSFKPHCYISCSRCTLLSEICFPLLQLNQGISGKNQTDVTNTISFTSVSNALSLTAIRLNFQCGKARLNDEVEIFCDIKKGNENVFEKNIVMKMLPFIDINFGENVLVKPKESVKVNVIVENLQVELCSGLEKDSFSNDDCQMNFKSTVYCKKTFKPLFFTGKLTYCVKAK